MQDNPAPAAPDRLALLQRASSPRSRRVPWEPAPFLSCSCTCTLYVQRAAPDCRQCELSLDAAPTSLANDPPTRAALPFNDLLGHLKAAHACDARTDLQSRTSGARLTAAVDGAASVNGRAIAVQVRSATISARWCHCSASVGNGTISVRCSDAGTSTVLHVPPPPAQRLSIRPQHPVFVSRMLRMQKAWSPTQGASSARSGGGAARGCVVLTVGRGGIWWLDSALPVGARLGAGIHLPPYKARRMESVLEPQRGEFHHCWLVLHAGGALRSGRRHKRLRLWRHCRNSGRHGWRRLNAAWTATSTADLPVRRTSGGPNSHVDNDINHAAPRPLQCNGGVATRTETITL